jgi:hypothetical protein
MKQRVTEFGSTDSHINPITPGFIILHLPSSATRAAMAATRLGAYKF